eukprot:jgi/Psemu1/60416/gm1.60416_g
MQFVPSRISEEFIALGAAHSKMISAHKAFFIPFELVPFLLGKGLSPRQAMGILYPYLNHQVLLLGTCGPLFDILRPSLTNYMKNKVLPPGDPALTAAVTALTDHQLRLSEGLDQRRSQSVGATWGPLYTKRLLLLYEKLEEADLPPSYQAWAKKSKHKKTHMIFQSQVSACASKLFIPPPLVTTAVLKRFQDGTFHGTNPFDAADGILPLAFTPLGGSAETLKREQEAAANIVTYGTMISTEGNSLALKDSLELQKTKAYIPVDWTKATTQLKSYLAVLATILGTNHEVVTSYQQGLMRLKIQQMPLCSAIADELGELITPAIVIYYFQIRGNQWTRYALKRVLFQSLDKEPASLKKMLKGGATWTTKKVILGWLIDSVNKTISLPPHHVLGELQSMALPIPGSIGLFSILQEAFQHKEPGRTQIQLTKRAHNFLQDFKCLANDLSNRPTAMLRSSHTCMGGIHFVSLPNGKWVPSQSVSFDNPQGTLNNSDLELVGSIAHNDVLAQAAGVNACTTHNCYDNTAAVYWQRKGTTTTTGPAAYLLWVQALHQRLHQYVPLRDYIPDPVNHLANLLSHSDLSDTASHAFCSDLSSIQVTMQASVTELYARQKDAYWTQWVCFCLSQGFDPLLQSLNNAIHILQVFAERLHYGRLSCSNKPIRSCTVLDTIHSVGQTLACMGAKDSRTNSNGSLDFNLTAQFKGYTKLDPTSSRAIANIISIAFFFCLGPGEYMGTTRDDQAFLLQDVSFYLGS